MREKKKDSTKRQVEWTALMQYHKSWNIQEIVSSINIDRGSLVFILTMNLRPTLTRGVYVDHIICLWETRRSQVTLMTSGVPTPLLNFLLNTIIYRGRMYCICCAELHEIFHLIKIGLERLQSSVEPCFVSIGTKILSAPMQGAKPKFEPPNVERF